MNNEETMDYCPFCGFESPTLTVYRGKDGWSDRYCVTCRYDEGGCGAQSGLYHTAYEAIAVWNKRVKIETNDTQLIPRKVTREATLQQCCTCPRCKNVIDKFIDFNGVKTRVTYNYCHFCGQALDWSDI